MATQVINHTSERFRRFYDSFEKLILEVDGGKKHTDAELLKHPYCDYLKTTYRSSVNTVWTSPRWKNYLLKKIKDGINLYHDIEANGMKNPIEVRTYRGKTAIVRGNRRFVIAKVLGICVKQ